MTTYEFGDVVLLAFPHTDLVTISKRPAVVIYDSGDQDVLVARVTAQEHTTEADYKLGEWRRCGLLVESYVRLGKQATVENNSLSESWEGWKPKAGKTSKPS